MEEPIHEAVVGKGLIGVLSLLQERGTLKEIVVWVDETWTRKINKLMEYESNNVVGQ